MEWNEHKRKNIIFEKIKKFKKAEGILEKRLSDCRLEFSDWCDGNRYEDVGKGKVCTPVWHSSSKKQQKLEVNDENIKIFEYYINESIKFAVGKNSQSNDYLRIKWGKKNDYWFHIDGMKSAHLIIKVDSLNQLSQEHLIIIASVLRDYSSLDITSIPVVFTQVKNLKGVKGRAGAVLLKKQKYLTLNYEKNWKEIISRD
jgi:predicted ribosome quality control (RQC) complex YloA/Tae2 family protein